MHQGKVPLFEVPNLSRGVVHNAWLFAVAGIGGFKNEAQRNDKTVLMRHCPRYQTLFETQSIFFPYTPQLNNPLLTTVGFRH